MPIYSTSSINFDYVKVRWQEPYVSNALNRKLFGLLPKGIYSGFTIGPGGLSNRDIIVTNGSVSGGLGTGLQNGYVSGGFDETIGFSIAIHNDTSGFSTTISIPPTSPTYHLDATGLNGQRVYIVLDAVYAIGNTTSAAFYLVNGSQIDTNPSYIVVGYCDVPSNPVTPLDLSMFGYNDATYPRLTPIATSQKAGFMPASAFALLNQFFAWQNLCAPSIDPNSNFVVDILPSQTINTVNNTRIFTYVLPNISSRFPRNVSGNYNGGVNNTSVTTLNITTGQIGGAHQISGNTSFSIPSVSGTPSSYQVGLIALDAGDGLNVSYGNIFSSSSQALLDVNLPASGSTLFPVASFLVSTDVSGHILPMVSGGFLDRRPFLNLGGGGGGGASSTLIDYLTEFQNSTYGYINTCIFSSDGSTFTDNASTGVLDLVTNEFAFSVSGQTFVSKQNLGSDFLSGGYDLTDVSLRATWDISLTDTSASYFLSRDGGVNYQSVSMTRIDSGSDYVGRLVFANTESTSILSSYVSGNINANFQLDTVSGQSVSEPFTLASSGVATQAQIYVNKVGSPGGSFTLNLVKDSSGVPSSTSTDTLAISAQVTVASLSAGQNLITATFPSPTSLPAGNYHLVVQTDAVYRSSFVSGTTEIDVKINSGTPTASALLTYNGSVWSTQVGKAMIYYLGGRSLDLRAKIVAGTAGTKLAAYSVQYGPNSQFITQKLQQQTFVVNGSSNTNAFTVTNFLPNPYTLKVYQVETGQVFVPGSFSVNGQVVTFPANSFNLPGQTITLIFDQTQGAAIDTSDANASAITTINSNLASMATQLSPFRTVDTSSNLINVPNTTIINRAQVVDPSNSLGANFGINRIITQQIFQIQNEFGPNGENISGVLNDTQGYIRFGGTWTSAQGSSGQFVSSGTVNDFVELIFYGTGLNVLYKANNSRQIVSSVDGGAEGGNILSNSGTDSVLDGRNVANNSLAIVTSGLTLGLHTVKLRVTGTTIEIYGFEIVGGTSNLSVNTGNYFTNSTKLSNTALYSSSVSGSFESGTLGSKGGRVSIYIKSDGTIGKAVNPTDVTQQTFSSASHTNEELLRSYNFLEFGAGLTTDFSRLPSSGSNFVAHTLDDASTNLIGKDVLLSSIHVQQPASNSTSAYVNFTFVGTGLDFAVDAGGASPNNYTILLDGVAMSAFAPTTSAHKVYKLVSGLPMGTHIVNIKTDTAGNAALPYKFMVYGPKKPTLPTGAVEIADYFLMATFAQVAIANGSGTNAATPAIDTGVLRKHATREAAFFAGVSWIVNIANGISGGAYVSVNGTANTSNAFQVGFFGTGFNLRGTNFGSQPVCTITLNGLTLNTTNFPALTASVASSAGASFNTSTGIYTFGTNNAAAMVLLIQGLPLAEYVMKATWTSSNAGNGSFGFEAFDIITPIYSPKSSLYGDLQNTLPIGSQAISDNRKMSVEEPNENKVWAQANYTSSNATTTSTSYVPIPDMSLTITTKGNPIEIFWSVGALHSSSGSGVAVAFLPYVDGVAVGHGMGINPPVASCQIALSDSILLPVGPGVHKLDLCWLTNTGTATVGGGSDRILKVREI